MQLNPADLQIPEFTRSEIARCRENVEKGLYGTGLIVDANNIMYRMAFATSKDCSTATELLAAFIDKVRKTAEGVGADVVVCCLDHGVTLRRSMLGARKKPDKTPEDEAVVAIGREALHLLRDAQSSSEQYRWLNVRWLEGYEADDICAAYAVSGFCVHTVICSTDSDIYQVTDGSSVTQLSPATGKFLKSEIPPELVPGVKALAGDSSDSIEGLKGVGNKTALDIMNGLKTRDLTPAELRQVRDDLMLTALPFPGSHLALEFGGLVPMPPMYEEQETKNRDDETVPF